jgi:hypothetical protein
VDDRLIVLRERRGRRDGRNYCEGNRKNLLHRPV